MALRSDLLKAISGHKDLTNVIVLTFNIDLLFVEHVFLRALRKCGHPTLTIFADAEEIGRTFESQRRWLAGIGQRYRVVPVAMTPGYRFHPKAALLSGPETWELLVGSGNLTFGGLRQNEEIWISFSSPEDAAGTVAQFRGMLEACLTRANAPRGAQREVEEAYDASTHSWAGNLDEPDGLIWRMGEGPTLIEEMLRVAGSRSVERIIICSPFFDGDGLALRHLSRAWPDARVELLVQPKHSTLSTAAISTMERPPDLLTVASGRKDHSNAFVHGKFYALYSGNEVLLFAGSANCSAAAMGLRGKGGNGEMLAYRVLGAADFEEDVLGEMIVSTEQPELRPSLDLDETSHPACPIGIIESRYEHGVLTVVFQAGPGITVNGCCIDDADPIAIDPAAIPDGKITLELPTSPHFFRLLGQANGEAISSRSHWIDNEFRLSATSRQRKLAQAIEGNVSPTSWSFRSWAEVLRLLGDHLRYEPKATAAPGNQADTKAPSAQRVYRPGDFYTADYRLPARRTFGLLDQGDDRILGLQHLLLEYFGVGASDAVREEEEEARLGDDEAVDVPEAVLVKAGKAPGPASKRRDPTESERNRARRVATKLVGQILDEEFLQRRSDGLLANDLTIVAVLLVAGLSEGWLTGDLFFRLTYEVWTRLFFDGGLGDDHSIPKGWLQLRTEAAERPDAFIDAVGTVPLTAALAMWSFMCPPSGKGSEQARFHLASRMAVARLPWLWNMARLEEVADEVHRIAVRTHWIEVRTPAAWAEVQDRWDRMLREGIALGRFEECLAERSAAEWRDVTERGPVAAGSLVWQGRLGFGVTTCGTDSRDKSAAAISVLLLRAGKPEANIKPYFMLPVQQLIEAFQQDNDALAEADASALRVFVAEMEGLLAMPSGR